MSLTGLPTQGKEPAARLVGAGIHTLDELRAAGCFDALESVLGSSGGGCLNMLYALEGAIRGIRWHGIPKEDRAELKAQFDESFGNN